MTARGEREAKDRKKSVDYLLKESEQLRSGKSRSTLAGKGALTPSETAYRLGELCQVLANFLEGLPWTVAVLAGKHDVESENIEAVILREQLVEAREVVNRLLEPARREAQGHEAVTAFSGQESDPARELHSTIARAEAWLAKED